jgi:Mg2+ and Co2+ transporter CorA
MTVSAHRLNVLVALFFPIATITAIFGMNFNHGLEAFDRGHSPWLLIGVTIAGLFLGLLITAVITRPAPSARRRDAGVVRCKK